MQPKNFSVTDLFIKVPGGYEPLGSLQEIDISDRTETEQDKLNRMAVEVIRKALPDNLRLVMNDEILKDIYCNRQRNRVRKI